MVWVRQAKWDRPGSGVGTEKAGTRNQLIAPHFIFATSSPLPLSTAGHGFVFAMSQNSSYIWRDYSFNVSIERDAIR